jgi:hypothetical protein
VQMTAPAHQTTGRFLGVSPGTSEILAAVILRETSLGYVRLHTDCNMARLRQFEQLYLLGLWHSR